MPQELLWNPSGVDLEIVGYRPVSKLKFLAYPSEACIHRNIQCSDDTQTTKGCCLNSPEARSTIAYYSFLKKMGFSYLVGERDRCQSIYAATAGWTKDEIVMNATGADLADLVLAETVWNNLWTEYHPAGSTPPPFHDVWYDEVHSVHEDDNPILPTEQPFPWSTQNYQLPNFPLDVIYNPDLPKDLCQCLRNPLCEYNHWYHTGSRDRYWLMSMFVQECLGATFT